MSRRSKKTADAVGVHVNVSKRIVTLASGAPLAPLERVTLTPEAVDDPHNKALIADGVLLHVPAKAPKTEPAREATEGDES